MKLPLSVIVIAVCVKVIVLIVVGDLLSGFSLFSWPVSCETKPSLVSSNDDDVESVFSTGSSGMSSSIGDSADGVAASVMASLEELMAATSHVGRKDCFWLIFIPFIV